MDTAIFSKIPHDYFPLLREAEERRRSLEYIETWQVRFASGYSHM
jgi:hypothetical protein